MSRRCTISKKRPLRGHKVSHANKKALKVSYVNLHSKRLFDSESGKWVRVRVSSRILRTIDKKGLAATLRENGLTIQDIM
jgi:large subunit ribosomal protein L28